MPQPPDQPYPRARLDALTDGIYAVAMTLLVLDVRLPDNFEPTTGAQLAQGLLDLLPKVYPYLLSFMVLGLRWLAFVRVRSRAEWMSGRYVRWWLLNLMVVTCVPFSTIVVGRHASLAPAVWLYAGNMGLLAILSWLQTQAMSGVEDDHHYQSRQIASLLLLGSALLAIAISFVSPEHALWALTLNLLGTAVRRHLRRKAVA